MGQAGYYKVRLTDYGGIDAEATALTRAAAERYTFAPGADTGHVLINVAQANDRHVVIGSQVQLVGDRVVEGKLTTQSFCGGQNTPPGSGWNSTARSPRSGCGAKTAACPARATAWAVSSSPTAPG